MSQSPRFAHRLNRVVLKLSGEALAGGTGFGLSTEILSQLANEILEVRRELDVELAVVVGGGNFWRAWTAPRPTTWACWPR
jgi:uridylate kinase